MMERFPEINSAVPNERGTGQVGRRRNGVRGERELGTARLTVLQDGTIGNGDGVSLVGDDDDGSTKGLRKRERKRGEERLVGERRGKVKKRTRERTMFFPNQTL